ncbi:MAG: hypothetical protein KDD48_00410 [Bdellovibrionales bacterium]|nr:hypothetical protein [Bdellovibrionales bacterium]
MSFILNPMCPICEVNDLSSSIESHVIPRWMIIKTKEIGKNVKVTEQRIHSKNQGDIKSKIVCKDCELRFKQDDDFAKTVFDSNMHIIEKHHEYTLFNSSETFLGLRMFAFSILLRWHLYRNQEQHRNVLGPYFSVIRDLYRSKNDEYLVHPILLLRYNDLTDAIIYPILSKLEGKNCYIFTLINFEILIVVDKSYRPCESMKYAAIQGDRVLAMETNARNSKLIQFTRDIIKLHK